MKNFIRKMAEKLNSLPFNKKIKWILVAGSLLISGFLMVLASVFSVRMMTKRFQDLTNANITTASEGVENLVEQYGESLKSIIPDKSSEEAETASRMPDFLLMIKKWFLLRMRIIITCTAARMDSRRRYGK